MTESSEKINKILQDVLSIKKKLRFGFHNGLMEIAFFFTDFYYFFIYITFAMNNQ